MGCFFACFRVRDKRHLPTTTTVPSSLSNKRNDVAVSRNRLSTLFQSEEREDPARDGGKNFGDRELKNEAKFLKASGTISRTAAEIRKASEKLKVSPSWDKDSDPSRFRSSLPNTSAEKVQLNVQPFNPLTPVKYCEEWGKVTDSLEHTPSSCISNAQNIQCDALDSTEGSRTASLHTSDRTEKSTASVSPWPSTTYTKTRNKSVRFECDTDLSSCDSSDYGGWHRKKTDSTNNEGAYKPSPYPTPMKLSDEMQTPGTVRPATLENLPKGKSRVQSQFGYSVYKVEDVSQTKIPAEEDIEAERDSRKLSESVEQSQNSTSTPEKGLKKMSYENESKVEESLSSWLKPASVILEERNKRMEIAYTQIRKTPADRPIIGMVAAHWNEDEDSHVPPPKWWDGNGIPNSTTKYKEDQKVNWHATPFEERLEKALSEESFTSQRKDVCGKPIAYESEESDTALSQLQSSTHPQSVVSF
ncbi:protein JASON-like [Gastrolobium bilobum]|uniref:protein JASON-like n=1 Tax=Gastrolobium bilobum TaxID=150636 RepID=UPI002AB2AE9A|nr:protein JASON-like [Gastrolobium bilobum]